MISTSGIFSTGEKKCRPMKCSGRDEASARPVIGRVEVLEANTASGRQRGLGLLRGLGLDLAVLEHRLDHQVWQSLSAPKSGVAVTLASSASALSCVEAAALHQLAELVGDVRLALVGGRLVAVDQHDVEAGLHRDGGDARAHQAGAEHADLLVLLLRHALGPAAPACWLPAGRRTACGSCSWRRDRAAARRSSASRRAAPCRTAAAGPRRRSS